MRDIWDLDCKQTGGIMKVYIVTIGFDCEGFDIDSVWFSLRRAEEQRDRLQRNSEGDYNNILIEVVKDG